METVGQPPAEAELHLLTDWSDPDARSRHRTAAAGALGINFALVAAMWLLPESFFRPPELPEVAQRVTPLVMPLPELTQHDPNHGKVSKEFEVQAPQAPRRAIQMPPPPLKGEEAPKPAPPPPLPEPPKVETARETPPLDLPRLVQPAAPPPQPQIQTEEKPKLTFENPPPPSGPVPLGQRQIPLPTASIGDIAKSAVLGTPIGTIIGDAGAWGSPYNGMSQSPAPGNPLAAVQLRSDTEGVDFKPYLMQLIATIKRNWLAVIPESARMGRRGKVSLQFVIAKDGNIDKIVFAEQSGSSALDRAAVSGVSASNPLPPLPREFKGTRIVLQLNFVYR